MTTTTPTNMIAPKLTGTLALSVDSVRKELGDEPAAAFEKAVKFSLEHEDDSNKLSDATEMFVKLLQAAPKEKLQTAAFAELLLGYARTLLFYMRKTASNPLLGGDVEAAALPAKARKAAERAGAAKKAEKEEDEGKETEAEAGDEEGKDGEKAEEKVQEEDAITKADPAPADGAEAGEDVDVDDEELVWEQLEHARAIFEKIGADARPRLANVLELLGEFQLECDKSKEAAEEYAKAIAVCNEADTPNLRVISHLHYSRYLALRKEAVPEAVAALEEAVGVFAKAIEEAEEKAPEENKDGEKTAEDERATLVEMRAELRDFKATAEKILAEGRTEGGANGAAAAPVTVVQPKRRPAAEKRRNEAAAAEPVAKKARVEAGSEVTKESAESAAPEDKVNGAEAKKVEEPAAKPAEKDEKPAGETTGEATPGVGASA